MQTILSFAASISTFLGHSPIILGLLESDRDIEDVLSKQLTSWPYLRNISVLEQDLPSVICLYECQSEVELASNIGWLHRAYWIVPSVKLDNVTLRLDSLLYIYNVEGESINLREVYSFKNQRQGNLNITGRESSSKSDPNSTSWV